MYIHIFKHDPSRACLLASGFLEDITADYNRLQLTATDGNRLQQTAADCNRLQQTRALYCNAPLQLTAAHHGTLPTHCNSIKFRGAHCSTLQGTARICKARQDTARHCNTLQHTHAELITAIAANRRPLKNKLHILQHTATHSNTLYCTTPERNPSQPRRRTNGR